MPRTNNTPLSAAPVCCQGEPDSLHSDDDSFLNDLLDDSEALLSEIEVLHRQVRDVKNRLQQINIKTEEVNERLVALQRQKDQKTKADRVLFLQRTCDTMKFF
jgi:predicted  nucleic acid-binding Zn-ribbon protein